MTVADINGVLFDALADSNCYDLSALGVEAFASAGLTGVFDDNLICVVKEIFRTYKLMNPVGCEVVKSLSKNDLQTIIDVLGMPNVIYENVFVSDERTVAVIKFDMDIADNTGDSGLLSTISLSFDKGQTFVNSLLKAVEIDPDNRDLLRVFFNEAIVGDVLLLIEAGAVKNINSGKINPATTVEVFVQVPYSTDEAEGDNDIFVVSPEEGNNYTHIGIEFDEEGLDWLFIYVSLKNVDWLDKDKITVTASCITEGYTSYSWSLDKLPDENNYYKVALDADFFAGEDSGKKFNVTVTYDGIIIGSNDSILVIPDL